MRTLIELINDICKELESKYNLIVKWNRHDDYIEVRIWNSKTNELLKHCVNTELNTINMLRGIKFGIQATLSGDITNG